MANIGVRSPYFVNYTDATATALSSKIEVSIDGTLRYTVVKNTGVSVRLDISDLARDYVTPTFSGAISTLSAGEVEVDLAVTFYDDLNAEGTIVDIDSASYTAFDGYRYFSEGNNFNIADGVLLSGNTIWAPEDTEGSFLSMVSGSLSLQSYSSTATSYSGITIKRQQCSKYTPIRVVFVNKFGVPQELWFFTRSNKALNSNGQQYKSGAINSNGTYNKYSHQVVDFHKNGKINHTLNTGFVDESYTNYMQELMLSEQVWMDISGVVSPVRVLTSSVQYKTSLNDKLVQYTVDFEQANDVISTVR